MDEILASIRRIISEDSPSAPEANADWRSDLYPKGSEDADADDDVLVLTQRAPSPEPQVPASIAALVQSASAAEATPVEADTAVKAKLAAVKDEIPDVKPTPKPAEAVAPVTPEPVVASAKVASVASPVLPPKMESNVDDKSLVSETTAADAMSSFGKLTAARASSLNDRAGPALPEPGRTLEDLTRELLEPMLQAWLDANLATIVQEHVEEEIARITRGRTKK